VEKTVEIRGICKVRPDSSRVYTEFPEGEARKPR
jgi:hypothetical protein